MRMGYSREQIARAFTEVSETSPGKEMSSLWPSVLCRLREDDVYDMHLKSQTLREDVCVAPITYMVANGKLALYPAKL